MPVEVRTATPDDYAEAGAICEAAYRADGQLPPVPRPGQPLATGNHDYAAQLRDVAARAPHGEVLVAVDGPEILGCVTYVRAGSRYAELAGPGEAEFRMLAVSPAAQGRGAGAALVQACLDRAVAEGCAAVVICVRDFSAPAKRLYARFGFARDAAHDWSPVDGVVLEGLRLPLVAKVPAAS